MLSLQGYIHTLASQSMRNKIICLIGEYPCAVPKVTASAATLSLTLSVIAAIYGSGILHLSNLSYQQKVAGLVILWGSVFNCLAPTFIWEARFRPRFASLATVFTDFLFFSVILSLASMSALSVYSFVLVLASKWFLHSVTLWLPILFRYKHGELVPHLSVVTELALSIPIQALSHVLIHLPISTSILAASWATSWSDTGVLSIVVMVQQVYVLLAFQLHRTVQPYLASQVSSPGCNKRLVGGIFAYSFALGILITLLALHVLPRILQSPYVGIQYMIPIGVGGALLVSCNQMLAFQWTREKNEKELLSSMMISGATLFFGYAVSAYFHSILIVQLTALFSALVGTLLLSAKHDNRKIHHSS